MSLPGFVPGMPRIGTRVNASHRIVFRNPDWLSDLAGGKIIDGSKSRDPDNTGDVNVLRAGLLMGKITSSSKYAPAILGLSNAAYTAGGTTLTVTSQFATELARRIGASGTFRIVGPPSANGVVAEEVVTYSAVATATTVTVTALGNSYVSGSYLQPNDGSEDILSLIPDGYGVLVTDTDGTTNLDVPFSPLPIAGVLYASQVVNYPSDTSLRQWLRGNLNYQGAGKFVLDDLY